jgi:hypothetical protein
MFGLSSEIVLELKILPSITALHSPLIILELSIKISPSPVEYKWIEGIWNRTGKRGEN